MQEYPDRRPAEGPDVVVIFRIKALLLAIILASIWLVRWFVSPTTLAAEITLAGCLALLPAVAVAVWPGPPPSLLVAFSLTADVVALTICIHYGGGVDQVSGPLLYSLIIGLAGMLLSSGAAYVTAGVSVVSYTAMVWAEYAGWLPHRVSYSRPPDRQVATVLMVSVYLWIFAWLVSFVAREIRSSYLRAAAARSEAIGALSHDLKNPLAAIHGYAAMIQEAPPLEAVTYAQRIASAAGHALDLVRNVLDATAFAQRPLQPEPEAVPVGELLAQVVEQHRFLAEGRGVEVRVEGDAGPSTLYVDRRLAGRALGNLLSNAVKHSRRGDQVMIRARREGTAIVLSVCDTGCGIDPAVHGRLFQPFSRLRSGSDGEGTGLGLYIVRRIAEAHGGAVELDSAPGRGSEFRLRLPAL
jgi:signal transduction histidine kinase